MPRNGSGTYTPPDGNPVETGTIIESEWANETIDDIALALTNSISIDGQTIPIANLPMGGFRHTNVGAPTLRNQYSTLGMVQDGAQNRLSATAGVNNITGTLVGNMTSYTQGQIVTWEAPGTNTGPMTLNINDIGPRSLFGPNGEPLPSGSVVDGAFLAAVYDGVSFRLLNVSQLVLPVIAEDAFDLRTSGQIRPPGGAYPALTVFSPTQVTVPAGSARIVPANADSILDTTEVSWVGQNITLSYLGVSFSTTIAVDINGTIVQYPGRPNPSAIRDNAILGVAWHPGGTLTSVQTRPVIFGGDGYLSLDVAFLLSNSLVAGGKVTASANPMQLDVAAGFMFMVSGEANTITSPNLTPLPAQTAISFRTLVGASTLGALINTAPVTSYDPNGGGVLTTIPNNGDATIHRLYYLNGQYIWAYGQRLYTVTGVEQAMSFLEWDRTQWITSSFLSQAVLIAEIVAIKTAVSLANIAQAAILAPDRIAGSAGGGGGGGGGIPEAPIDGTPYGRQNAAWVGVLGATSPAIINSASITGANPILTSILNPAGAGTGGFRVNNGATNWFAIDAVLPDDRMYIRSYDPVTGILRHTLNWNMATGELRFPVQPSVGIFQLGPDPGTVLGNGIYWDHPNRKWVETNLFKIDPLTGVAAIGNPTFASYNPTFKNIIQGVTYLGGSTTTGMKVVDFGAFTVISAVDAADVATGFIFNGASMAFNSTGAGQNVVFNTTNGDVNFQVGGGDTRRVKGYMSGDGLSTRNNSQIRVLLAASFPPGGGTDANTLYFLV